MRFVSRSNRIFAVGVGGFMFWTGSVSPATDTAAGVANWFETVAEA